MAVPQEHALRECIRLADRLLSQLELDRDSMQSCIRGELLEEYRKATDAAAEKTGRIKRELLQLQAEQSALGL